MADTATSAKVRFEEQLEAIRRRTADQILTERWTDVMRNGHDRGFVVAGAAKADLLSDLAGAVEELAGEGRSIEWFRERFDDIVEQRGWAYRGERNWRTRVIYTTNLRTSYAAGRLAQLRDPDLLAAAPYWMYKHGGSADPRPQHLDWDGLTLPADDPWWKEHYPPNGWGCSCYVVAVSAEQARRLGGRIEPAPASDPSGAIDPGWDYMPGDTVADDLRHSLESRVARLPAELGAVLWRDAPVVVRRVQADEFASWADSVAQAQRPTGKMVQVGAVEPAIVQMLVDRDLVPDTAAVLVRDIDTLHTHRPEKEQPIPWEWYRRLPERLPTRQAVLLDRRGDEASLLYIYPDPDDLEGAYKLVIPINYRIKVRDVTGKRRHVNANIAQTGRRLKAADLRAGGYELLEGEL